MKKILFKLLLILLLVNTMNIFCQDDEDSNGDGTYTLPLEPLTMMSTGSVGYSIPIKVPDGRAGIQPSLAITYNSYLQDGWVGHGWSLSGLGSISRSRKLRLNYDAHDFIANGKDLVPWDIDENGNGEYREQINEDFKKYEFNHDTGWVVTLKNGIKYYYGLSSDERQDNEHGVFKWLLSRVEDPNGNYLTVSYIKDPYYVWYGTGQLYPDQINYTGNNIAQSSPTYKVRFHYGPREDDIISYATHSKVVTSKRLTTISVWFNDDLVNAYKLAYYDNPVDQGLLNKSYLKEVTMYGNDALVYNTGIVEGIGTSLPPVKVEYTSITSFKSIDFSEYSAIPPTDTPSNQVVPIDYTNDGFTDFIVIRDGNFDLFTNWDDDTYRFRETIEVSSEKIIGYTTGDFNGDGMTDILVYTKNQSKLCLSVGASFEIVDVNYIEYYPQDNNDLRRISRKINVGDFNGDGRMDIYFQYDWLYQRDISSPNRYRIKHKYGKLLYLANNEGFEEFNDPLEIDPVDPPGGHDWETVYNIPSTTVINHETGDFNGDGQSDLIENTDEGFMIRFFPNGRYFEISNFLFIHPDHNKYVLGDYNGDGITDILFKATADAESELWLFNRDFHDYVSYNLEPGSLGMYDKLHPGDFNGDGRTDLLAVYHGRISNNPNAWDGYKIYLSKGNGFECVLEKSSPSYMDDFFVNDFNGDNVDDFMVSDSEAGDKIYQIYLASVEQTEIIEQNLPDLLGKLDNGRGGTYEFKYHPSSLYMHNSIHHNFVKPVVVEKKVSDGNGNTNVTGFEYRRGIFKRDTREFLGFQRVTKTLADGRREITWYFCGSGEYLDGIPIRQRDDYYMQGKIYRQWLEKADSDESINFTQYYWETRWSQRIDGKESWFVALKNKKTTYFEDDGSSIWIGNSYTYDPVGNLMRKIDFNWESGNIPDLEEINTYYNYDNFDTWLWRKTEERIENQPTSIPRQVFRQVFYDYDNKGNLIREEHYNDQGDNPVITYDPATDYDDYGNRLVEKDFKGNKTVITYDPQTMSKVETMTNPKVHVQTYYYNNLFGTLCYQKDPNGNYTNFEYDPLGRLKIAETYDKNNILQSKTINNYYLDSFPNYIKTSVLENTEGQYIDAFKYFDGLGRTIQTVSRGENKQWIVNRTFYDDMGRQTDVYGPYFSYAANEGILYDIPVESPHAWTESFDERDRPLVVKTADEGSDITTNYSYYKLETTITDADGASTTSILDGHGRIKQTIQDPEGENVVTNYTYNAVADLLTITDVYGAVTSYTYNTLGQVKSMTDPNTGTQNYEYDLNGNLEQHTDAKNQVVKFTYDSLNRLETKHYENPGPNDHDVINTYDDKSITINNALGKLSRQTNGEVTTEYTDYDTKGMLLSVTKTISGDVSRTTNYSYDLTGKMTKIVYPDDYEVNTEYYPGCGLIKRVWSPGQSGDINYVTYEDYPAMGKIHNVLFGNGVQTIYEYKDYSTRLNSIRTHLSGTDYINREYTYTPAGDIETINDLITNNIRTYAYDKLHRLRSESSSNDTYSYLMPISLDYSYADENKPYHAVHTITTLGISHDFDYDANGNLVNGEDFKDPLNTVARAISYNADNMPAQIEHGAKGSTTFAYDSVGKRAKKTTPNGTTYYINDLFEVTPEGEVKYIFAGNSRVAVVKPDSTHYIHSDHLGSTSVMTDENGQLVEQTDYLPFGSKRKGSIELTNYGFTDQELDDSTNLYNYNARLYDPVIGQFTIADPTKDGLNWYAYCNNNPLKYIDPTGESYDPATSATLGHDYTPSSPSPSSSSSSSGSNISVVLGHDYTPSSPPPSSSSGSNISVVLGHDYTPSSTISTVLGHDYPSSSSASNISAVLGHDYTTINLYKGLKGKIMKIFEFIRHDKVMKNIDEWNAIIEKYAVKYNVDPNLIRAIIYEEQTHNKTPNLEWIPGGPKTVGPMAIHKINWKGNNRWQMMNPDTSIRFGSGILGSIVNRLGSNYSIIHAAGMYNSGVVSISSIPAVSINYGFRVENFYNIYFK